LTPPKRKPSKTYIIIWFMSGGFYGLKVAKAEVEAFSIVRNALQLEVRRDGAVTAIYDWYMRDEEGNPEPVKWHESGESKLPRWKRKYLVVWWMCEHAHAIVFWSDIGARDWAAKTRGLLFEVTRSGAVRETGDYKNFAKNGKAQEITWRMPGYFKGLAGSATIWQHRRPT